MTITMHYIQSWECKCGSSVLETTGNGVLFCKNCGRKYTVRLYPLIEGLEIQDKFCSHCGNKSMRECYPANIDHFRLFSSEHQKYYTCSICSQKKSECLLPKLESMRDKK